MNIVLIVCACFLGMTQLETEVDRKDLTECQLPHGTTILLQKDTCKSGNGDIYSFSRNKFSPRPFEEHEQVTNAEFVRRMREQKAGDLCYYDEGRCVTFFVVSGRIADLGKHYLHEFDGKDLARPGTVAGQEDGEDVEGIFAGVQLGHCYLVETIEGTFVLLRFIAIGTQEGTIQWALQPDKSRKFAIPKNKPIPPPPPKKIVSLESPTETVRLPAEDVKKGATITEAVDAHLKYRKELIKKLIGVLEDDKATQAGKVSAVKTLGQLHAEESTDALIKNINVIDKWAPGSDSIERCYPAVTALVNVGKFASVKSVEAVVSTDSTKVNVNDFSVALRIQMLVIVVRRVEGADVARFLLESELKKAKPEFKPAIQKALEYLPPYSDK